MSRLYEGETVETYNPKYGTDAKEYVEAPAGDSEFAAEALERGRAAEELLASMGWTSLKARIDGEIATLTASLISSRDANTDTRLKAAIQVYKNIEGFINRDILEGQVALKESELLED